MKCLVAIVSFSIIALSQAQGINLSSLPDCAKPCALNLPKNCGLDPSCICAGSDWISSTSCCVSKACSPDDQKKTLDFASQICSAYKVTLPSAAGCVDSANSASASSTAASTASVSSTPTNPASASSTSQESARSSSGSSRSATSTSPPSTSQISSASRTTGSSTQAAASSRSSSLTATASPGAAAQLGQPGVIFAGVALGVGILL